MSSGSASAGRSSARIAPVQPAASNAAFHASTPAFHRCTVSLGYCLIDVVRDGLLRTPLVGHLLAALEAPAIHHAHEERRVVLREILVCREEVSYAIVADARRHGNVGQRRERVVDRQRDEPAIRDRRDVHWIGRPERQACTNVRVPREALHGLHVAALPVERHRRRLARAAGHREANLLAYP